MSATVREAVAADAELVLTFVRELADYERLAHEVVATPAQIAHALGARPPRAHAAIAEVDGAPAGFAVWFVDFSTFAGRPGLYLEDIFVRPAYRGRGVGAALMRHLARVCLKDGLARIRFLVLDWNEEALGFYRRHGAEPVAGWTAHGLEGDALERLAAGDAAPL